uniref:Uncharacterized protein n=1 Tax=Romanomermis culicivorax TaxID=13658 RepID=A0A915I015_ROMCU
MIIQSVNISRAEKYVNKAYVGLFSGKRYGDNGAKQPAGHMRRMMSHCCFMEIFAMGMVNWSYDIDQMECEIARV